MPEVLTGLTFSQVNPDIYEQYRQTRDAEMFEQLVFDYMLNKHSDDQELKDFILSLPRHQKRTAIVSVIDGDNNLWNQLHTFIENCPDKLNLIKNIIHIINKFVKDGEVERKKYGEVMTPISLVKQMLDTLPKEVWSNPNLKWLDPANGAGTFPFVVIYKLMNGLAEWEPNMEKRYKHIVENMIYTCELQSRNVILWLLGVDPKDEYTTNTYWGSFLDEGFDKHMKEVWCVEKFDIILGNPPYQEHKEGFDKTKPIWNTFVLKSISILKEETGILNLIHPSGWRSPAGIFRDIFYAFMNRDLAYLSMNDFKRGFEVFGVGTNFDYYMIINRKYSGNTKIKCSDDKMCEVDLSGYEFIPNGEFETFNRLIAKSFDEKVKVLYSRSAYGTDKSNVSKFEKDGFRNPCVYTITQKSGINLFWSDTINNGHFGVPKIIWSNGLGTYPIIDEIGQYGLTQFSYAISADFEDLPKIKEAMESPEFIKLMEYAKFTNNKYDYKVISTFKAGFWNFFINI